MTVLAGSAVHAPAEGTAVRWGTVRTVLRLHRTAFVLWGAAVLGFTGWLVWLTEVAAPEEAAAAEACSVLAYCVPQGFGHSVPVPWIGGLVAHAFLVVAAFAGGALIGRELESGTARLAWTQSVTPTRWLATKLAVPALALALGTGLLVVVYRWAWGAHPDLLYQDWAYPDTFVARGPLAVAYVLCALAVGTLTAFLLRRTLAALGVSVAVVWALLLAVEYLRPHLWPAVKRVTAQPMSASPGAWELDTVTLVHGKPAPDFKYWQCDGMQQGRQRCLDDLGVTGFSNTYHPQSHYLPLHLVETGIVLAVAALATAAAFTLLRRRTA